MFNLKSFLGAAAIAAGTLFSSHAFAADVEVDYSAKIAGALTQIDTMEQRHEEYFREYYDSYQTNRINSANKFNYARFEKVNWAGETLIPNIADYTLTNLTKALVNSNLEKAGMGDLSGTIRVTFERLKVAHYSVSTLRANDTFVVGTMDLLDDSGKVVKSVRLSTNLVYGHSVDVNYEGPDYAFYSGDAKLRVGPVVSRFVEKGLEELFPDQKFHGPVLIGQEDNS